jgi:hypothetical protein
VHSGGSRIFSTCPTSAARNEAVRITRLWGGHRDQARSPPAPGCAPTLAAVEAHCLQRIRWNLRHFEEGWTALETGRRQSSDQAARTPRTREHPAAQSDDGMAGSWRRWSPVRYPCSHALVPGSLAACRLHAQSSPHKPNPTTTEIGTCTFVPHAPPSLFRSHPSLSLNYPTSIYAIQPCAITTQPTHLHVWHTTSWQARQ